MRRISITRVFGLFMACAMLFAMVAGCGSDESTTPASQPAEKVVVAPTAQGQKIYITALPTAAPTQVPAMPHATRGGVISRAMGAFPTNWDILQGGGSGASEWMAPAYQQLLQWSPEDGSTLMPDLAATWDITDGGEGFIFHLVDSHFSNGEPVTAEDVRWSYDRIINPPEGMVTPRAGAVPELVASMEVLDDKTIKFNLSYAAAIFLPEVASGFHSIQPKSLLDGRLFTDNNDVIGSGPWMIKDFDPDVYLDYEKQPHYFLADYPLMDGVRHLVIADAAARVAAFQAGKVDITNQTFPETSRTEAEQIIKGMGGRGILSEALPAAWILPYYISLRREPWDNKSARQAIHLAINRKAYTDLVEEGLGGPQGFFQVGWLGGYSFEELLERPGFRQPKDDDIAEAKRLLAEAGVQPGHEVVVLTPPAGQLYTKQCILLAEDLEAIGLKPTIETITWGELGPRRIEGDFDFTCQATGALYLDTDSFISLLYLENGGRNWGPWMPTPKFLDLYYEERGIMDPVLRDSKLREMHEILFEELPILPGAQHMTWTMISSQVQNYHWVPVPFYNNTKLEQVWLTR